ncbi:hypothetical protein Pelo_518 [Pelomyxa schiedti]|nr:hypothetical protein Pelo_518 [Pelomyxa schiedti]
MATAQLTTTGPFSGFLRVDGCTTATAQSLFVALALASHPRCGARTSLGCPEHGGPWLSFLRQLWSDFVLPSRVTLVADIEAGEKRDGGRGALDSPPARTRFAVSVCVSPLVLAPIWPVTTHPYTDGDRLDLHRHIIKQWVNRTFEIYVEDTAAPPQTQTQCRPRYKVHPNNRGIYSANSKWVVMFTLGDGGNGSKAIIHRAEDLASLKFTRRTVNSPRPWYMKYLSFCAQSDPDKAVLVVRELRPREILVSVMLIDVAKSFYTQTLVVVFETKCQIGGDPRLFGLDKVLSLKTAAGTQCFVLRKTNYDGSHFLLCGVYDGVHVASPIRTNVDPKDLMVSQVTESQFCVSPRCEPSAFAELWDCSDLSGPLKVLQFGELGGTGPGNSCTTTGTMEGCCGFLFVNCGDRIKVIHATSGVCCLTV